MPVPSRKLKDQVEDELDHYASTRWPQLEEVTIRWRGSHGYLTGYRVGPRLLRVDLQELDSGLSTTGRQQVADHPSRGDEQVSA